MTINVMSGSLGDIFWDLPPWMTYTPGFDLGCSIYVANPTDSTKEYALMSRLSRDSTVISEEALPVFGNTWFEVGPSEFVRLRGALRFDVSDADLAVLLVEHESGEVIDAAVSRLVAPQGASALPPAWPGTTGAATGYDWSSVVYMMLPVMMMGMVVTAAGPWKEEPVKQIATGQRKLLPEGREP